MTTKTLNRSFAAGEISPQLFSRLDLDKFQTGLSLCQNMETLAQGPAQNRPGFQYVLAVKYSHANTILLPFSYSTQQTFALEFGDGYIRFHTNGGTLLEGYVPVVSVTSEADPLFATGVAHNYALGDWLQIADIPSVPVLMRRWVKVSEIPSATQFRVDDLFGNNIDTSAYPAFAGIASASRVYEVVTDYPHTILDTLHFVQSADVLTIVTELRQPFELRRLSATNWTLQPIQFTSALAAPQSSGAVANPVLHEYAVASFVPDVGFSNPTFVSCSNDLTIPGYRNVIGWSAQSSAVSYDIYKKDGNGNYRRIGAARTETQWVDDGTHEQQQGDPFPTDSVVLPPLIASATPVAAPSSGVTATPTGGGAIVYRYVVTSVNSETKEESLASGEAVANNDLSTAGNFNTVQWPTVAGVSDYNVYRYRNGLWGFVGSAGADGVFVDQNVLPDTSVTPPIQTSPFNGAGNFPRAVSYHQQRRVFGGTINQPQNLWMTRSGTEKNLGYSIPSRDDDSVTLRVVSREANTIRHIVPMDDMILLTSGGEWQVSAADSGPITPSNVSVKPQGYTGASNVQPAVTNRTILFAQDRGGAVRELEFSWQSQSFQTTNVSILAPHLFDYHTVKQLAFSRSPVPCLWSVRDDGVLLGMTYVPEHDVKAWHQHTTDGAFESVCSVAEGDEDVIYAVVRRTVNGQEVRYVERKHTRRFDTPADQFFVDSGLTYSGAAAMTISGLHHLEGRAVSILADGGVSPRQVVVNGQITLDAPASKVQVGLPYVSRMKTLPLSIQTQAFGQGSVKNVNKVHLRVIASNGFSAGPAFDKLRPYPTRATEPYGSPPELVTGEVPISLSPSWQRDGSVCIEQAEPLSMMVLGMALEVATGS